MNDVDRKEPLEVNDALCVIFGQNIWPFPVSRLTDNLWWTTGRLNSGKWTEMVTDLAVNDEVVMIGRRLESVQ